MNALVFDLDGTLVESLPGIAASLNRSLSLHGLPGHSHAAVRGFIGDGARKLVERSLAGFSRLDLAESVLESFAGDYEISWPEGTAVFPGIRDLLEDLASKGTPLAVLSNKPHAFTVEIVEKLFPENIFAAILGNRDCLALKPDPAGAFEIAASLGTTPENCILIGDSTMDLETATNAGMKSIAVTWGYHDRKSLFAADLVVESVSDLSLALS